MRDMGMSRREALCAAAAVGMGAAACAPRRVLADSLKGVFAREDPTAAAGQQGGVDSAAQAQRPSVLDSMASVEPASDPHAPQVSLAGDLSNVVNLDWYYLNDAQRDALARNGLFCMLGEGGNEFFEMYEMNRYTALPNFVTVDSMLHTYHLYFSHLLRSLERTALADELRAMSDQLEQVAYGQLAALRATSWESAAVRACAFFTVGACLQGMEVSVPPDVAELANAELGLVYGAGGIADSPLFGCMEDYSHYVPRGYYEGDELLEGYFRAMMWYGRMNFASDDEDLDRSALLVVQGIAGAASQQWEKLYAVTSFFTGASDDSGYCEYLPLVRQAYGKVPSVDELAADEQAWERLHALTAQAAPPRINSLPVWDDPDADVLAQGRGFRLMGQRFSVDEGVFQQLVYSKVKENAAGERRMLPDVLDVACAFGSMQAQGLLEQAGAFGYEGYAEHMEGLQGELAGAAESLWRASLSSKWLDMLRSLCREKGEGYPSFMQSPTWARHSLQSFAGSYAELKHDTVLYAKQIMAEMGGGELPDRDDRGYVEPEPEVFGQLAALTQATSDGLELYGLLGEADRENLARLAELAARLEAIARKELADELPTEEEFDLIRTFGGQIEHFWQEACKDEAGAEPFTSREFPAAIVADIATDPNGSCLEVATGQVSKLYVPVPRDGQLVLMTGAVYSFYQFAQPLSDRLTDTAWRRLLGIELGEDGSYHAASAPDPVWWTQDFCLRWADM